MTFAQVVPVWLTLALTLTLAGCGNQDKKPTTTAVASGIKALPSGKDETLPGHSKNDVLALQAGSQVLSVKAAGSYANDSRTAFVELIQGCQTATVQGRTWQVIDAQRLPDAVAIAKAVVQENFPQDSGLQLVNSTPLSSPSGMPGAMVQYLLAGKDGQQIITIGGFSLTSETFASVVVSSAAPASSCDQPQLGQAQSQHVSIASSLQQVK